MGKLAKPVHTEDLSRNQKNGSNENCPQTNQEGKNVVCSQLDSDKGFTLSTQQKNEDSNDRSAQKPPVSNKTKQSPTALPREHGHSQVSVQPVNLPGCSLFTEEALNKDYRPRFAFKQPSKDLNIKSKIQTSIVKSPLVSKPRKNVFAISQAALSPVDSSVQPSINNQKESEQHLQLSIPTNISTQKDEQQKRKSKLSPSLSSPLLSIKTSAFSASPGSLHKEIQQVESTKYQDEPSSQILPSDKQQKKHREDCSAKDQGDESQADKLASSVRHSRLPKPKTHASTPTSCNFQG